MSYLAANLHTTDELDVRKKIIARNGSAAEWSPGGRALAILEGSLLNDSDGDAGIDLLRVPARSMTV